MPESNQKRSHSRDRAGADARRGFAQSVQQSSPYISLGWQLAASVILFVGAGYLLDSWLNTRPWLTVSGAVLGVVSFFALIYKLLLRLEAEEELRKAKKRLK